MNELFVGDNKPEKINGEKAVSFQKSCGGVSEKEKGQGKRGIQTLKVEVYGIIYFQKEL